MRSTVEPLEGNKVKVSVEVDETEFDKAIDAAFRKIGRETRIPGFRPGKAPRRLLEARFGTDVAREEAIRDALPDYYIKALEEQSVDAIAPPEIEITGGQESGPIQFEAVVEIRPQVSVAGYGGLRVTIPSPAVTDDEVDRQLDRLREQFGELQTVARPARDGDHLSIDLSGYRHSTQIEGLTADDFLYELGSGSVVPELDEQLRGTKAGDILKFTAPVPGQEEDVAFQVLVKEVKEKILPEVTDEWATEASEFETVEALRDDIRTRLGAVKKVQAQLGLREQVVDAVVELVSEEIPEPLVNEEMQRRLHDLSHRLAAQGADLAQYLQATGRSAEEFQNDLRESAARAVQADLALRAVADAEGLESTDAELDAEIERIAQAAGQKPAAVRKQLDRNEQLPAVRSDIRKGKALAWLTEHVEIADEEGKIIDRAELMNPTPDTATEEPSAEDSEDTATA
ncbi:MAG: Trigger factor [Acidimicrobiales bacterium]|nr:Trigger factor [Acidimicrobiales bacterium]